MISHVFVTLIHSSLFLAPGFDSSKVEKSTQINVLVITHPGPHRFLLPIHCHFHVGRIELSSYIMPLAVAHQNVAAKLNDSITLNKNVAGIQQLKK